MSDKRNATLVSVVALDGRDEPALLAIAASLADGLKTPIGAAIRATARERDLVIEAVDAFHETTAAGVAASLAGRRAALGDSAMFARNGLAVDRLGHWPETLRQRGQHVLFVAVDGCTVGFLGVITDMEDEMRESRTTAELFPRETSDLPEAQSPELVEMANGERFDLRIAPVTRRVNGATVRMLAYNGSIPGPILRVPQGAEITIDVVNDGDLETTVHWHGLRLDNRYDGTAATQRPIPVGGAFTYRLSFPDPGVYWYHPHVREDYGQEMGLYGNIVVVPAEADYWPPVNREVILTLDDIRLEDGRMAAFSRIQPTYTAMGRFGNVLLINGDPDASLRVRQGEIVRLFLTNTANTRVFNVALPGVRMKLVGGDSGRYERETFVDRVLIAPSERAIVDVLFDRAGQMALEHHTPDRTYRLAAITVDAARALPSLASQFESLRTHADIAAERAALLDYFSAAPDKTLAFIAEMDMGGSEPGATASYVCPMHPEVASGEPGRCPKCRMKLVPSHLVSDAAHGMSDHAPMHAGDRHEHQPEQTGDAAHYPAGIEWEDDMLEVNRMTNPGNMRWKLVDRQSGNEGEAIDWRFRVGDRVKIRLINELDSDHPMHHPFHIHGAGRFLILSRDGQMESNLVWKDTVLVPTGQTVDILLHVTHPGVWMAHCHIAEHHESGMMLRFHVER